MRGGTAGGFRYPRNGTHDGSTVGELNNSRDSQHDGELNSSRSQPAPPPPPAFAEPSHVDNLEHDDDEDSDEAPRIRRRKRSKRISSVTNNHNTLTHFPKDPNCPVCRACKVTRAQCRQKGPALPDDLPKPEKFADAITGDHMFLNKDDADQTIEKLVLILHDSATKLEQDYPCKTKSIEETTMCLKRFLGPQSQCKHAYTDGSAELEGALAELDILHDSSTPYRPETNGVIERAVRRIKEGTSCALVQSGLAEEWWPWAVQCFCFLRCIHDKLVGGQTAWQKRFGSSFKGPFIPFGAEVQYYPITEEDKRKCHKFGSEMLPGIFFGYSQHAGGGWNGDLLLAD